MSLRYTLSALTFAAAAALPLAGFAAASPSPAAMMKPSPKPSGAMMMSAKHQCRDAKGHFIKGTYTKCPNGSHKA